MSIDEFQPNQSNYQLQMQKNEEDELEIHKNQEFRSYDLDRIRSFFEQSTSKSDDDMVEISEDLRRLKIDYKRKLWNVDDIGVIVLVEETKQMKMFLKTT